MEFGGLERKLDTHFDFYCIVEGELSRAGVGKLRPAGQMQPTTFFVNKVLLEHSHAHLFIYCIGYFCPTVAELKLDSGKHIAPT